MEIEKKIQTPVKSAFLKTPTVQEQLKIGVHSDLLKGVHPETLIRVKIEIDTEPAVQFICEEKFLSQPVAISIKCVNEEFLFAGKMHAALFRVWKGRVKGRDWYDLVWFIRKGTSLNLRVFSKLYGVETVLTRAEFLKMAKERIDRLDISAAVQDIINFVRDQETIQRTWSKEFFHYWIDQARTTE